MSPVPSPRTDVLIVGAGPAGMAAAVELKRLGVNDLAVVDRDPEAGGLPRLCHHTGFGMRDLRRFLSGPDYAGRYRSLAQQAGVAVHTSTTITAWKDATRLLFTSPDGLGDIEARAVLLATGCRERPRSARLVPGSRPQGVFTTGSLQHFVYEQRIPVGKRAVIAGAELVSLSALMTLMHVRIPCAMMVTELPDHQIYFPYLPMKWLLADLLARTPIVPGTRVTRIGGRQRLEGVEVTHLDTGRVEWVACDTVIFTGDWIPEHEIARTGGLAMDSGTRGPQVDAAFRTSRQGVFAAGNVLRGAETADTSALEGRRAARHIHQFLGDGRWPERGLPIEPEPPLAWICPNVIADSTAPPPAFNFRSREFRDNVRVRVHQGERLVHTRRFKRLIVNESMQIPGNWLARIDPRGGPVRVTANDP